MNKLNFIAGALVALALCGAQSHAKPEIDDYGSLPNTESVVISPDGNHYAFIKRTAADTRLVVYNVPRGAVVGGAKLRSNTKGHYVYFATNNYVVFRASKTSGQNRSGRFEFSGAYAYSIRDDDSQLLLARSEDIYPSQSGLGRIVGVNPETEEVYMPAFSDRRDNPYDLYKVSLKTGRGYRYGSGRASTLDWFVDSKGNVLARADMNTRKKTYTVYAYPDGKATPIYTEETDVPPIGLLGVDADEKSLLFSGSRDNNRAVFRMSLADGEVTGPVFAREGSDLDFVKLDINQKLRAVAYGGLKPHYDFVDDAQDEAFKRISASFKDSSILHQSSSADMTTHLFRVSGSDRAGDTIRFTADPPKIAIIGRGYPNIEPSEIGIVTPWIYTARDGLEIPSVLTWPVEVPAAQRRKLPLLVFPHGGPSSHDRLSFNWWAQYFAARGYAIFQPNFRGSDGFGVDHERAGDGEWGKKMQDDITDGVRELIDAGVADPKRICIMGASYGGYAALAGGAFTPELYACVIAFAPVSDIPRMLNMDVEKYGRNHWVTRYWADVVGDRKEDRDALKAFSPVNFAEKFDAPVLLLHGRDDTVVPLIQSTVMRKALKRAKKPHDMKILKGEDHWLSGSDTRRELLSEMDRFLMRHNPPN